MPANILVACFSATGVTAGKAQALARVLDARLYHITPETPYTKADLNWLNPLSRTTKEMHRKSFRPPLADTDAPVADSGVIFLGFPIWWYVAPTIINTFLEAYDFSGKKIVLFATSGGSGFGKTAAHLKDSAPGAELVEGRLLNDDLSDDALRSWARAYL